MLCKSLCSRQNINFEKQTELNKALLSNQRQIVPKRFVSQKVQSSEKKWPKKTAARLIDLSLKFACFDHIEYDEIQEAEVIWNFSNVTAAKKVFKT